MMNADINYAAVLVAGISMMVIGGLVYGPILGKKWMDLLGTTQEKMAERVKKGEALSPAKAMGSAFIVALLQSYILAHFVAYTKAATWTEGIVTAFWLWLGFVAAAMVTNNLFEGRKWGLVWIFLLNSLLSLLAAGAIIAAWA